MPSGRSRWHSWPAAESGFDRGTRVKTCSLPYTHSACPCISRAAPVAALHWSAELQHGYCTYKFAGTAVDPQVSVVLVCSSQGTGVTTTPAYCDAGHAFLVTQHLIFALT